MVGMNDLNATHRERATEATSQARRIAPDAMIGSAAGAVPGFASAVETVVPRITMDAFCATPDFAAVIQSAIQDRRMARAITHVDMGGVSSAVKRYDLRPSPNLIIVESQDGGFGMFAELERLAAVVGEDTFVIVAGASNDVALYRELIRQGVSEYIVTPSSPMQVIEAIASVFADPDATPSARVISIVGVKGGVGSSILAHNLAWLMSNDSQQETVLVDLDIEFGTAALDFNLEVKHSIVEALGDADSLDDVKLERLLYPQTEHLKLLPAPAALHSGVTLSHEGVMALLDAVRQSADTLIFDVPHSGADGARAALRQADEVVLVANPDLACLRNLKTLLDWLNENRQNDIPPRIVLNQTGVHKRPEIPMSEIVDVVGAKMDLEVAFDGGLFATALNNGQMLSEIAPQHKIVGDLRAFGQTLLGKPTAAPTRRRGFPDIRALANVIGVARASKKASA